MASPPHPPSSSKSVTTFPMGAPHHPNPADAEIEHARRIVTSKSIATALSELDPHREQWSSQIAFLIACTASAVGMGNLWRFPFLAYRYGGGAFFVPYIMALVFVGLPMLLLEFAVGQIFQGGSPKSFDRIHKRLRGVGFGAAAVVFVISTYYSLIIVWSMTYLINSFLTDLPWTYSPESVRGCPSFNDAMMCGLQESCSFESSTGVCAADVLKRADRFFASAANLPLDPNNVIVDNKLPVSLPTFGLMILLWGLVYLSIRWGTRVMGKILIITMVLPTILLIVLLAVGLSREGASLGIAEYIGKWEFEKLSDTTMWTNATGQIIFSIGIAIGVMTAYASHNSANQNVTQNAVIVGVSNSVFSFFCGLIVFSIAGSLAYAAGVPLEKLNMGGTGLAFQTYPVGVSTVPYPWAQIICILFFTTLFFLGFDTLISLTVSASSILTDSRYAHKISRSTIVGIVVLISAILSIVFFTPSVGFTLLDVVDNYLNNVCLMTICMGEALAVGWVQGISTTAKHVGHKSLFFFCFTLIGGVFFTSILISTIPSPSNLYVSLVFFILTLAVAFIYGGKLAFEFESEEDEGIKSLKNRLWWLYLGNIECFREDVNVLTSKPNSCWRVPMAWSILIKYIVPFAVMFMIIDFLSKPANTVFYGDYHWGFILAGAIFNGLILLVVVLGAAYPAVFERFVTDSESQAHPLIDEGLVEDKSVSSATE